MNIVKPNLVRHFRNQDKNFSEDLIGNRFVCYFVSLSVCMSVCVWLVGWLNRKVPLFLLKEYTLNTLGCMAEAAQLPFSSNLPPIYVDEWEGNNNK